MKRQRIFDGEIAYLPGIKLEDFEFDPLEELAAVRKERRRSAKTRERIEELATKHILQQCRAVMRVEAEKAWLRAELAKREEIGRQLVRDLNRDICRNERDTLKRRGMIRGRR